MTGVAVTSKDLIPNIALKGVLVGIAMVHDTCVGFKQRQLAEQFEKGRQAAQLEQQHVP